MLVTKVYVKLCLFHNVGIQIEAYFTPDSMMQSTLFYERY